MKRFFLFSALFLWCNLGGVCHAQTREGKSHPRTEFISYDIRDESDADLMQGSKYFRTLKFTNSADGWSASLDIPALWLERNIYLRDTGRSGTYTLSVNGKMIGQNSDIDGGGEWFLTSHLREGTNEIRLTGEECSPREIYIFSQPRIHIADYIARGHFDAEIKDNVVDLKVLVVNGFNMTERVRVGYDIYEPDGKLKDFAFVEADIAGRSRDTVRLCYKITGTHKFPFPAHYRVTLSLRHGERDIEYIPLRLVFNAVRPATLRTYNGDFPTEKGTKEHLARLRKEGYNTIAVARPQQKWFYDLAADTGFWIVDRSSVAYPRHDDDRRPGGTVANDPAYLQEFLDRQAAMFYRRRNYSNIAAWSLGADSGNGFNMYRSYLMLKALDPVTPVIYEGAAGEWNSDEY